MKVVVRSYGTPYADRVQGEECWDIMAVSPSAREVAVRFSFRVFFFDKPALVGG